MKEIVKILLFVVIGIIISACSTKNKYAIEYDTLPSCASLICDGEYVGLTPVIMSYDDKSEIDENGILHAKQCKAVFKSGYVAKFKNRIDTNKFKSSKISSNTFYKYYLQTIRRPQGVGYSQDLDYMCSDACSYMYARQSYSKYGSMFGTLNDLFLEQKHLKHYSGLCP